jgi:hypothetical protein
MISLVRPVTKRRAGDELDPNPGDAEKKFRTDKGEKKTEIVAPKR